MAATQRRWFCTAGGVVGLRVFLARVRTCERAILTTAYVFVFVVTSVQYDLYTTSYSPDGRVFQVEYAAKAVETSGTAVVTF
jgi:hypothetical protein